jgi:site-specific DNA-methyltransferase (adenine-specific)
MLVMSNREWFRYSLVWDKKTTSGFLNAKKAPLRGHEDILVFYQVLPTYNPQMSARTPEELRRFCRDVVVSKGTTNVYKDGLWTTNPTRSTRRFRYPSSVIRINGLSRHKERGKHPTQKPVALMEYLIRTYSNVGETVLDNCFGSGTTGVACINTERDFIGIEKDPSYFAIASKRIAEAENAMPLLRVQS